MERVSTYARESFFDTCGKTRVSKQASGIPKRAEKRLIVFWVYIMRVFRVGGLFLFSMIQGQHVPWLRAVTKKETSGLSCIYPPLSRSTQIERILKS